MPMSQLSPTLTARGPQAHTFRFCAASTVLATGYHPASGWQETLCDPRPAAEMVHGAASTVLAIGYHRASGRIMDGSVR